MENKMLVHLKTLASKQTIFESGKYCSLFMGISSVFDESDSQDEAIELSKGCPLVVNKSGAVCVYEAAPM